MAVNNKLAEKRMYKSDNKSLFKEFNNWKKSSLFSDLFNSSGLGKNLQQSVIEAGLENALMYLINQKKIAPRVELLDEEAIHFGFDCVSVKLTNEQLNRFLEDAKHQLKQLQKVEAKIELGVKNDVYYANQFQLPINKYTQKAFDYLMTKNDEQASLEILLIAALRYASIFAKTRHIGPPQTTYDLFYEWGVRNEAFASPFNARLLGKEKASFFSLFKDTDKAFGSKGSFFDVESPKSHSGDWCFDPPFIKELLESAVEKLVQWKNQHPSINFILIVPDWFKPNVSFNQKVLLEKNTHYYEGLDGVKRTLPVDVAIYLIGEMEYFSLEKIKATYTLGDEI